MRHLLTKIQLVFGAVAVAALLSACGGGGGGSTAPATGTGGSTSSTSSTQPGGTVATAQYTSGSAQAAMFTTINQYRQECGFPAMQENTVLDQAAQNHTQYMAANGNVVTDTEVQGNAGFTGVTGQDRANALGWPSGVFAGAADAGFSGSIGGVTNPTQAQVGQQLVAEWVSGVYHSLVLPYPASLIGFGYTASQFTSNSTTYPFYLGGAEIGSPVANAAGANGPLTFPCDGVTGLPYEGQGETPTAPGVSGPNGTPVVVMGNLTDTVVLQSGTMTDPHGNVINLSLLNSSNDPNKLVGAFEAVAFPPSPLSANTTYSVTLTGTINGSAFSRNFSFTTGNAVG